MRGRYHSWNPEGGAYFLGNVIVYMYMHMYAQVPTDPSIHGLETPYEDSIRNSYNVMIYNT